MPKPKPLIGLRFGKWIAIAEVEPIRYGKQLYRQFLCRCDCGKEKIISYGNLTSGASASCGCVHREIIKHGHASAGKPTRTYRAWCSMKSRCKDEQSKYWGAKGVKLCERWEIFENFLADKGECPPKHEIDRWPNRHGDYTPENTRWATDRQQNRNRSDNRILTVRGITACLSELCEHFGVDQRMVWARLNLGWPIEDAFFAPKFTRTIGR